MKNPPIFQSEGKFYDWHSGAPVTLPEEKIQVKTPNGLFNTWMEEGERVWDIVDEKDKRG